MGCATIRFLLLAALTGDNSKNGLMAGVSEPVSAAAISETVYAAGWRNS
jgi:hypothetical protein